VHCTLGPLWRVLGGWEGELEGRQLSARGGLVRVECLANNRVALRGAAVVSWAGELFV